MDDAYFASLDATASGEQYPKSGNIARRSMSIFSRRGAATPEPISFVPIEAIGNPKQMSEKQRGWLLRRRDSGDNATSPKNGRLKSPRGTVLHAVPPANVIRLSALEEEMARSPNAEILSAISEHAPTLHALTSPPYSPVSDRQDSPTSSSTFVERKGSSRRDASSRIGVWVDGVTYWNEGQTGTSKTSPIITGFSPVRPIASETNPGGQKPCLSVLISNGELQLYDDMIYQPRPHRPLSSTMHVQCSVTPPLDRPHAPLRKKSPASRVSRSSTSSSSIGEEASVCSKRSSATSIEAPAIPERRERHSMVNMSQHSLEHTREAGDSVELPHWAPPIPPRAAPCPPATRNRPMPYISYMADSARLLNTRDVTSSSDVQDVDTSSPTWSQAEHDLQRELSTSQEDRANAGSGVATTGSKFGSIRRNGSVHEVMQPPSRAPTIPKRSRKRDWRTRVAYPASELKRRQSELQQKVSELPLDAGILRKSVSVSCGSNPITTPLMPRQLAPCPPVRSTRRPLANISVNGSNMAKLQGENAVAKRQAILAAMTPTVVAEDVLLNILSRLRSPKDLFHTAIINKGMYRVFKENEIHLLRTVVYNESPAAWELREWSPPDETEAKSSSTHRPELEHSPLSYMRCYRRDMAVIERLKRLILETCQSFLRRETVFALSTPTHPNAPRFYDAFSRIWTFCKIFGCSKNREDDITGQMDWLRGGVLANNEDCIASTDPNMDFDMMSVLISPPACFAEGNQGGLRASQLFDMLEMWSCVIVLLQRYHGRVEQARYYGIFDNSEVQQGDVENEEALLEEWTAYLLTLGPSVVLEMAQLYPAAGFALAKDTGWTRWQPPLYNGSRTSFLKEPVAKSYEEQVVVAKQRLKDPREQDRKDASRRRVATLAAEIRLRRQSSAYKRSPLIDMSTERAMSITSRRDSVSPTRSAISRETSRRASAAPMTTPRTFHPIAEDRVETFVHRDVTGLAKDTGERAIQQLVAMGFEREMSIDALRITDRGEGLRPDRAVELLLRQQE